jgi:hypothetical protein
MHDTEAEFYGGYDQAGLRMPTLRMSRRQFFLAVVIVAAIVAVWAVI